MSNSKIKTIIVALAILSFAASAHAAFTAGYTVYTYGGHQYALTITGNEGGALSWADAQAEAVSVGGNLVTINDAAENTWLTNTFSNTYGNLGIDTPSEWLNAAWIGLQYTGTGDILDYTQNWAWVDGDTSTYRATVTDPSTRDGDSTEMYLHGGSHPWPGTWNHNMMPTYRPNGIIEISSIPAVPAPGAIVLSSLGLGIVGWLRRRRSL